MIRSSAAWSSSSRLRPHLAAVTLALTIVREHPNAIEQLEVVGHHHARVANRAEILSRVQAEGRGIGKRSHGATAKSRSVSLGTRPSSSRSPCLAAIALRASESAAIPYKCTATIATVLRPIKLSTRFASISIVRGSGSTGTGLAPACVIASHVAINVLGGDDHLVALGDTHRE